MDFALILDVVVGGILLVSCIIAFLRGFVREVLTIFGLGGAAITALIAGPKLAPGLEDWITQKFPVGEEEEAVLFGLIPYDLAAIVGAYIGLFVVTLILLSILSHYIAKSVHAIGLGAVDRSLGLFFGVARGLLLIGLLYLPFHILMDEKDKEEWFSTSHSYAYVEMTSAFLVGFMPESWARDVEDGADDKADPLKDISGENDDNNDEEATPVGTDEEAAEQGTAEPSTNNVIQT